MQDIHQNRLKSALLASHPQLAAVSAAAKGSYTTAGSGDPAGGTASGEGSSADAATDAATAAAGGGGASDPGGAGADGDAAAGGNVLQLKEVIGQGSFGVVYRWVHGDM